MRNLLISASANLYVRVDDGWRVLIAKTNKIGEIRFGEIAYGDVIVCSVIVYCEIVLVFPLKNG